MPEEYPQARRDESVREVLHGVEVCDPYRWLEDPDAAETRAFVDAQNRLTTSVLERCGSRERFKQLFTELYNYERFGTPYKRGDRWYYSYNSGLLAQNIVYTQSDLGADPSVLIDPNKLSEDGTVALMGQSFSEDGRLVAYALSSGGSDWRSVHVMEVDPATGGVMQRGDVLEHVKFSGMTWTHDNKGFFYARFTPPTTGDAGTETDINLNQQLMYHVVGRPQAEDVTVLALPDNPEFMMGTEITHDGRYLIIDVTSGCEPANRVWYVDLDPIPQNPASGALDFSSYDFHSGDKQLPLVKLVDDFEAQYSYLGSEGTVWTFQTNLGAPRYRVVRTDISSPSPPTSWSDVIPQHPQDLLQWAVLLQGGLLAVCYLHDVKAKLQLHRFSDGTVSKELPLPGVVSIGGFSGSHKHSTMFVTLTGFTEPGATYRYDVSDPDPQPVLFRRIATKGFNPDDFVTEQVFVSSKDGTRVPMFITHRKGLVRDGATPTLLYGYGGFNISLEPGFSLSRVCWMLAYGGIAAVANLRGGGEYGREWRNAGSLGNKQNVFDDFQACASYLQAMNYCSPGTLVIQGGSNGGLLVAACANQRPDLFGVVLAQVGVMDMLRFHKFTIGHAWVSDYGDPGKPQDFNWLLPYSPLHNVAQPQGGTRQYPAFLITTGDHDDRVVPLHSHKLTATLQHVLAGSPDSPQRNPLLTRVEVRAGHGAGKPTAKIIQEVADMLSYAAEVMGAAWRYTA